MVVVLAATAALAIALTTWNVAPGGSITLTGGKAVLKDAVTPFALHCQSSSGGGSLKSGHDQHGQGLGSIKTLTFATCTGPQGATYTVNASLTVPWSLNATSYNSTTGTTTMSIEGVRFTFSSPSGCKGTLNGTSAAAGDGVVKAHYTNSLGQLKTLAGSAILQLTHATGCSAYFQVGDAFTVNTLFTVSPVQTITGNKVS